MQNSIGSMTRIAVPGLAILSIRTSLLQINTSYILNIEFCADHKCVKYRFPFLVHFIKCTMSFELSTEKC
jgi:hypothetical protein